MKIAVIGGAGAMGSIFGGRLAEAGHDVTLIDVARPAVDKINAVGLRIEDKSGAQRLIPIRATDRPAEGGPVELALVFVKCYHTDAAVRAAAPLVGSNRPSCRYRTAGVTRRASPRSWAPSASSRV